MKMFKNEKFVKYRDNFLKQKEFANKIICKLQNNIELTDDEKQFVITKEDLK